MRTASLIAPLLLIASLSWAEEPAEEPAPKPKSGMVVPLAPKLPPELCGVQPANLRQFPIKFLGAFDGDTIGVVIDLGFGANISKKVQLMGAKAPDSWCGRKTKPDECEAQQAAAKAATEFAAQFLLSQEKGLFIKYWKDSKHGRSLGVVCRNDDGRCVNYELLQKKHATYYCGGKR